MTLLFKYPITFISVCTRQLPVWPLATHFVVSDLLKIMRHACAIRISTLIPVFSRLPAIWKAALAQQGPSLQLTIRGKVVLSIQLSLRKYRYSETEVTTFGVIMKYCSSLGRNLVIVRLIRFDEGDEFESSNVIFGI